MNMDNENTLTNVGKSRKGNQHTAQGVAELPGLVGVSNGSPGSTRRSSSDWKNGGGRSISGPPLMR